MEYQKIIEGRFSVRSFTNTPPSQENLESILEASRLAPTACNNQPQRIWVVTKSEDIAKIDECCPCRYNAPVVLIVGFQKDATLIHPDPIHGDWSYGFLDASISLTQMMLRAYDLGLGSCWIGMFDTPKAHALFDIPEDIVLVGLLSLGYPAEDGTPSEQHHTRFPQGHSVTWF